MVVIANGPNSPTTNGPRRRVAARVGVRTAMRLFALRSGPRGVASTYAYRRDIVLQADDQTMNSGGASASSVPAQRHRGPESPAMAGARLHVMAPQRFPIRIGRRSAPLLRIFFGVKASEAVVTLTDDPDGRLEARFGWSHIETPIANIVSWRIEGPWAWVTAIGVRISIRHRDVTFGGSPRGGVRVDFKEPPKLGPLQCPSSTSRSRTSRVSPPPSRIAGSPARTPRTKIVP